MPRNKGHRTGEIEGIRVRPSLQLLNIISAYPTTNAAAKFLGLAYSTLESFINHDGGISLDNAAQIITRTGLSYEVLFVHKKAK
jgi:hypothetical protein